MDVDRLFRLYAETRSPEPLAKVFDACAPRLLRAAVHLVGDAQRAEDLVQDAFLTAIERADDYDPTRPVEPWLFGILTRNARQAWKLAAREIDPERLEHRIEATPLEEALGTELSGALAEALDGLEPPYREALVLRLRHGLSPADIAHALGEAPGTVRVRLSRGMRKLRALLPAGFASLALVQVGGGRALPGVREVVLERARELATAGTGLLASLRELAAGPRGWIAAGAAATALGVTAALALQGDTEPGLGREAPRIPLSRASQVTPLLAAEPEPSDETPQPAPSELRRPVQPRVEPTSLALQPLVVIDDHTAEPIAGAEVETFGPLEAPLDAILARAGWRHQSLALVASYESLGSTPFLLDEPGAAQLMGSELLRFLDRPEAGEVPLHTALTDGEGAARVPREGDRLLVVRADGYAVPQIPLRDGEEPLRVRLRRATRLEGHVIDEAGERVERRLTFVLDGLVHVDWPEEEGGGVGPELKGAWKLETDARGAFSIEIPAEVVRVTCTTPGFASTLPGDDGSHDEVEVLLRPGEETSPTFLRVRRQPWIRVLEEGSGRPLEHLSFLVKTASEGRCLGVGLLFAPGGELDLFDGEIEAGFLSLLPMDLRLWTSEHEARDLSYADLVEGHPLEVRLTRTERRGLRALVVDGEAPGRGLRCSLRPRLRMTGTGMASNQVVAAGRTGPDGRVSLDAPSGDYLLGVQHAGRELEWPVKLPLDGELRCDLTAFGAIEVEVVSPGGGPAEGHALVLEGPGPGARGKTDSRGRARFENLVPGSYRMSASRAPTRLLLAADGLEETVELEPGVTRSVLFVVPDATGSCRPRLVSETPTDFAGWEVGGFMGRLRAPVQPDGRADLDLLRLDVPALEIRRPSGGMLQVDLDLGPDPPAEVRIPVRVSGPRFTGRVVGLQGDPCPDLSITAESEDGSRKTTARTDAEGHFELEVPRDWSGRLEAESFHQWFVPGQVTRDLLVAPSAEPTPEGTRLDLVLPVECRTSLETLQKVTLRGRLVHGDRRPVVGGEVTVWSLVLQAQEDLGVTLPASTARTDGEGGFAVSVPELEGRYRLVVVTSDGAEHRMDWRPSSEPLVID